MRDVHIVLIRKKHHIMNLIELQQRRERERVCEYTAFTTERGRYADDTVHPYR